MTRRAFALGVLLAPLLAGSAVAQESNFGAGRPEDRYFAVEAGVGAGRRGPIVEGYVINRYEYYATRVVVSLVPVDGAGRSLPSVTAYVHDVPPRGRTFFRAPVPAGATAVRASVAAYDWAPRGGGA
jgi:hypothetical protein